jgi:hypothetical protein
MKNTYTKNWVSGLNVANNVAITKYVWIKYLFSSKTVLSSISLEEENYLDICMSFEDEKVLEPIRKVLLL